MATRGIQQLKRLNIRYCEVGGSSAAVRSYLKQTSPSAHLVNFARENPNVQIHVQPRNGHHPYIRGEYVTGPSKQICVKNADDKRIRRVMAMLRNSSGRKLVKLGGLAVRGDCPSVQGVWTPMLDLGTEPFDMKVVEG